MKEYEHKQFDKIDGVNHRIAEHCFEYQKNFILVLQRREKDASGKLIPFTEIPGYVVNYKSKKSPSNNDITEINPILNGKESIEWSNIESLVKKAGFEGDFRFW